MEKEKLDEFKKLVAGELEKEIESSLDLDCVSNILNLVDYTAILANLSTIELNKKQEEAVEVLTNMTSNGNLEKVMEGLDLDKIKETLSAVK